MPFGIINGMRNIKNNLLTIDRAGRLVIPQGIRKRFGLNPGSRLEFDVSGGNTIILRPADEKPALNMEGGLYVHEGIVEYGTLPDIIDVLREQRSRAVWESGE